MFGDISATTGGRPIAWHLGLLCLVLIAPVLVLSAALGWSYAATQREQLEQEAVTFARDLTAILDRELAGLIATTEVMSLSPHLQTGEIGDFGIQAREVYKRIGINIVLRDLAGRQLVNTRLPIGSSLPVNIDAETDNAILRTKKAAISNIITGAVTRRPVFLIEVPVLLSGEVKYFLNLSGEPEIVTKLLSSAAALPPGWSASVLDRRNQMVASTGAPPLGLEAAFASLQSGAKSGDESGKGMLVRNGEAFLSAIGKSSLAGWRVVVSFPRADADAPLKAAVMRLLPFSAGMLALAFGLAVVFARKIERPIDGLAAQADKIGQGEPTAPLATAVREINAVSAALSKAGTLREQAEAALREGEARLDLAQAAGGVGTWDWDVKRNIVLCSRAYCELYGLAPDCGGHRDEQAWLAQVHPDDRERARDIAREALKTGHYETEYRIVRPNGDVRLIAARGLTIFNAAGEPVRFIGANVDVTRIRQADERVRELQREVLHAARLSAMGQMTAVIAHELNQPLGAATNFINAANLALDPSKPDSERARDRLDKAAQQTLRAGAILKRLRDFATRGESEKRVVSAKALLEEAAALALVGIKDPAPRLRFEIDLPEDAILVDAIQIQQVVFNLVRNAIEATEGQDAREIRLGVHKGDDEYLTLSVQDNGPGLPDNIDNIFQRFVTSKTNGLGLGLSICRDIVEAHGGRLWAERSPDGGALFKFTVPMAVEMADV